MGSPAYQQWKRRQLEAQADALHGLVKLEKKAPSSRGFLTLVLWDPSAL